MHTTGFSIRLCQPGDIDSLYTISLATADAGRDASHLYRDGRMVGHIYSAPYAHLSPQTAWVAEDAEGVAGYIVGVFDTNAFEEELERSWWPQLRALYKVPSGDPQDWDADQRRSFAIHHPKRALPEIVTLFPAHIHMNVLPRLQGQGAGRALLSQWMAMARRAGVTGVHLGANAGNHRGIGFWAAQGFARLGPPLVSPAESTVWFGQSL